MNQTPAPAPRAIDRARANMRAVDARIAASKAALKAAKPFNQKG